MGRTQTWWEKLGPETQDWLAEHRDDAIPLDVADQVDAAGGELLTAARIGDSGDVERRRFLTTSDRSWIAAHCPNTW
jgi:hypothetical protein